MNKKLRELRSQLAAIECELDRLTEETGLEFETVIEQFNDIVAEDCGQYGAPHRLFVTL